VDDLCDSGVIDSPWVSGGVPRGCLWRFTEAAADLPRTCADDFHDLSGLLQISGRVEIITLRLDLELFTLGGGRG
jgi:hypothetical protein